MGNLAQLSLNRVKSDMPFFVGATLAEKLLNARQQVDAILRQYVPDMSFDVTEARDVMSQVTGWVERNRDSLEEAMKAPDQTLPNFLMLNMGDASRVQQWVIAHYTIAAAGLGPWASGKVDQLALDPQSDISPAWAEDDARTRLNIFGMLVKMERTGELRYIFRGPDTATNGMGALPVWAGWAIVVAVIGLAAIVAYFYLESEKLQVNNALFAEMCKRAQAEGDQHTVDKCLEILRELQQPVAPWEGIAKQLGTAVLILGGGYLLVRYGVPWAVEQIGESKVRRLA